jgi:hypothetical protein
VTAFFVFAALAIAVFITVGVLAWRADKRRREMLMQWASNSGFQYVARDDSWCSRWGHTPFGEGSDRRARNVVTGEYGGRPFVAFDYSYEVQSGTGSGTTNTTTYHYAVCALQLPAPLPQLQVTRENVLTRFGDAIGIAEDIQLESDDFNRKFRVKADDRKFAYDVLTPRTMQALLSRPPLDWRLAGTDALAWSEGEVTPSLAMEHLQTLRAVVDGIPQFVWNDQT